MYKRQIPAEKKNERPPHPTRGSKAPKKHSSAATEAKNRDGVRRNKSPTHYPTSPASLDSGMLEVGHVYTALAIMAAGTDKLHNGSAMKVFLPMGKHGLITIALSLCVAVRPLLRHRGRCTAMVRTQQGTPRAAVCRSTGTTTAAEGRAAPGNSRHTQNRYTKTEQMLIN